MKITDNSFNLYKQVATNIPDCAIYIVDRDYDYILAEGEELQANDLTPEGIIGCNFFEVWPQEVTQTLAPYFKRAFEGERHKVEQKFDQYYYVQTFIPFKNEIGEVEAVMMVSQNISELKYVKQLLSKTDDELQRKNKLFETLMNTVGEGIIVTDNKGNVLLINPAAAEILDIPGPSENVKDWTSIFALRSRLGGRKLSLSELPFAVAMKGGKLDGYELYIENILTGKKVYIESSARPLISELDGNMGSIVIFRDITGRKEVDTLVHENIEMLNLQNNKMEQLLKHSIQNLQAPAINLALISEKLRNPKLSENNKEELLQQLDYLSKYFKESLDSLADATFMELAQKQEWDENSFENQIEEFKKDFKNEIGLNSFHIESDLEVKSIKYPTQFFKNIIYNLLSNALKFRSSKRKLKIYIRTYLENNRIKLEVKDNGLGIDMNRHREKLFGLYQTFHKRKDSKGVGLFLVKNQVESLGGKLEVHSEQGKGSVFRITF